MSTLSAANGLLAELKQSRLLPEDKLRGFLAAHKESPLDDQGWAKRLVAEHHLTAFQATRLLQGRWQELVFGPFRAAHKLHVGGMGIVFLAQHEEQPGWFAVKILKSSNRNNPAVVDMFRLEALALTTLRHPNIVRGIQYAPLRPGEEGGHYLAMEFVGGPDLGELVAIRRQIPCAQACDILVQAAHGLHFAHEHQFLHRDVKPGNIIVDKKGTAKLIDFGLARYIGEQPPFPVAPDRRPGTVGFLAPEVIIGHKARDRRSDIYSLGLTLYFALTGRVPFARDTPRETLLAQLRETLPPISETRSDVPDDVIRVFERMTAKRPADRFNSMLEVAESLQPFAARDAVDVNLRSLLRARAKMQHRKCSASSPTATKPSSAGGLQEQRETGLSDLRSLEAVMRRVSDELTEQRAENRRLQDELQQLHAERIEREEYEAELLRCREQLDQCKEENSRLSGEADEAKNTIATLRGRCDELEKSLADYKQQIHAITEQARELSAEVDTLQEGLSSREAQNQALRVAYEQATPSPDTSDSFDEIFADDSLLREIAKSRWGTPRGCRSARTQRSSREHSALAGV